jgi:hypothetical protein
MSSIRTEVHAFVKATKDLVASETNWLPLSDDEIEKVADSLAKVEHALQQDVF